MTTRNYVNPEKEYRVGDKVRIVAVPVSGIEEIINTYATIREMRFNSFFDCYTFRLSVYGDILFLERHIKRIREN